MLLDFRFGNYKSFCDTSSFSMLAAPKQKGLDYSLCNVSYKSAVTSKKLSLKGLCSSVIYGPNAAGKTNVVGAMDAFRSIILRGNIKNNNESNSPNHASSLLELIPNNRLTQSKPVEFSIDFFEYGLRIQYRIVIDLGYFLDSEYERKIIIEELIINDSQVFIRDTSNKELIIFKVNIGEELRNLFAQSANSDPSNVELIALESLHDEELFLCNGFKLIFSQKISNMITEWIKKKFIVIYRADALQIVGHSSDPQKKSVYVDKTINQAARIFGINSNAIGYVVKDNKAEPELCSVISTPGLDKKTIMSAELFESYGTIRFVNLFPLVIQALLTGATLIVDEFDASIHPMALMSIINVFHNDDINTKHAQLIFNTHNPIFLNSNLLRRDEIKFVERDEETHFSTLYSLSDFGTSGENGVRLHEDYMKNYFVNRYGAIVDIDFSPVFEDLLAVEDEV